MPQSTKNITLNQLVKLIQTEKGYSRRQSYRLAHKILDEMAKMNKETRRENILRRKKILLSYE